MPEVSFQNANLLLMPYFLNSILLLQASAKLPSLGSCRLRCSYES